MTRNATIKNEARHAETLSGIILFPLSKDKTGGQTLINKYGHTFPFHLKCVSCLIIVGTSAVFVFMKP